MTPTSQELRDYFRNHKTLTLYKKDGTAVTFEIGYRYAVADKYEAYGFKDLDKLVEFCNKYGFSFKPVIISL